MRSRLLSPAILRLAALVSFLLLAAPARVVAAQGLTEDYGPVVKAVVERGDAALEKYAPSDSVATGNEFSRLYFDVFEGSGMEFTLKLKDASFMLRIESGFSLIISQCMRGEPKTAVAATWASLKKDLEHAAAHYSSGQAATSYWGKTLQSFLILFREGIEAMLVVAALAAYLRRSGYADKVKVIWWGCALALAASVGAAWLLNTAIQASGASREALEGVTLLIAAAVLLYVSYWLTSKRDADRWQAFVKGKMDKALGGGSLFALGGVAFLAVFREGAETILFYQALLAGSAGDSHALWLGIGLAAAALVAVYAAVRLASVRLPLKLFFGATAVMMFAMAFLFAGQGIFELQVSGLIRTTRLEGWPLVTWLGLFPTRETVAGQLAVLALLPASWFWLRRTTRAA